MKSLRSLIRKFGLFKWQGFLGRFCLDLYRPRRLVLSLCRWPVLGLAETLAKKVLTLIEVLSAVTEKMSESDLGKTIYFGFTLYGMLSTHPSIQLHDRPVPTER
jgi:hypothetical protein